MVCDLKFKWIWAVVVAQLAGRSLLIPEDLGSNPAIGNFYWTYLPLTVCRKDETKKETEATNGPFKKIYRILIPSSPLLTYLPIQMACLYLWCHSFTGWTLPSVIRVWRNRDGGGWGNSRCFVRRHHYGIQKLSLRARTWFTPLENWGFRNQGLPFFQD